MANRFEQMRAFAGVVEAGGFSRATSRVGMSRAMVSRNVLDLEERLGVRLLNRTTRKVSPTEAGRRFYSACRRILDELEAAETLAEAAATTLEGELRVVAPVNFGLGELGPRIADFLVAHPGLQVLLSLNDTPIDPIESGHDIAIRVVSERSPTPSNLVMYELAVSRRILCASPDYLARHGEPQVPGDLSDHTCLCYSYLDNPNVWEFASRDGPCSVPVRARVITSVSSVLSSAAVRGLGIAYGPIAFFRDDLAEGRVRRILEGHALAPAMVRSYSARNQHQVAMIETFNAFMKAHLYAGLPP